MGLKSLEVRPIMSNMKQKTFEQEFEARLDFTPGDQLERTYKNPETETIWRTWSTCWDGIFRRVNKRLESAFGAACEHYPKKQEA
jgi:hypothetical protein